MPLSGGPWPLRVTPDDVGERVSLRLTADQSGSAHRFTDVVGELESWKDGVLWVRRRDGRSVEIDERRLVAGKVVPPLPLPRRGDQGEEDAPVEEAAESVRHHEAAAVLQGIAARAWMPPDNTQIGGWLLRAAEGFTRRANCVTPLGNPALFGGPETGLTAAIDLASEWFAARSLRPRFLVVAESPLDRELDRRGWRADPDSLFMTASVVELLHAMPEELPSQAGAAPTNEAVRLTPEPTAAWLGLYEGAGELPPAALGVLLGAPMVRFAEVHGTAGGEAVLTPDARRPPQSPYETGSGAEDPARAIGRATLDGDWVGLSALEVHPEHRRRGHALTILRALLSWAARAGAREAFLQVEAANMPAVALYEKLGFAVHHVYRYRTL